MALGIRSTTHTAPPSRGGWMARRVGVPRPPGRPATRLRPRSWLADGGGPQGEGAGRMRDRDGAARTTRSE